MPANGENKNVMCYIDAIYVYLRARAEMALSVAVVRRSMRQTGSVSKAEDECMG